MWGKREYQEFQNRLFEEAEEGYRDFVLTGVITERPLLGVRVPKCKEIAKEILNGKFGGGGMSRATDAKVDDVIDTKVDGAADARMVELVQVQSAKAFLKNEPVAFEEVLVRGLVIAELSYSEMVREMYNFIPLIDNWEICDVFCAACKKNIRKHRAEFLEEIDKMLKSLDEFQTRVALVCLLDHYMEPEYLQVIFDRLADISGALSDGAGELSMERISGETGGKRVRTVMAWDAYYVKMAIAWLISVLFVKFPEETELWFSHLSLPKWTYNKVIAKTCESYRVDRDLKTRLKEMKH